MHIFSLKFDIVTHQIKGALNFNVPLKRNLKKERFVITPIAMEECRCMVGGGGGGADLLTQHC